MPERPQKPLVILAVALSASLAGLIGAGAKLITAEAELRHERALLEQAKREKFEALDDYSEYIKLQIQEGCEE